jgi:acetyl coenzyme A synthetase (ADP forming)-like protein
MPSDRAVVAAQSETVTTPALPAADLDTLLPHDASLQDEGGLDPLLTPRSIAVIGASRRANTMGHQILRNLLAYGFTGAVYPVNPNARALCGVRAYATIADVPERVDMAVIVVPHAHVLDVATECCDAGVRSLVVISAGFREVGGEGPARERALTDLVRARGVRMVGPNCMGIVNTHPSVSMNATFATTMPAFGPAAFVSQSGALGLSVLDHAREYGIGISQFVSVGNKPDVSGNDLLLQWERDPAVRIILMYVESFGNPRRFLRVASRITKTKPIVVVKAGRSEAGARAASSHTGALAADDVAVDAMLAQAGVLRASTVEELFDIAMAFGVAHLPRSRRTAVLTNAGGPGILATDAMEAEKLVLPPLSDATVHALAPLFPEEASIRNPLDMVASASPAGYTKALTALLGDPVIDAVVPIFVPPFGVRQEDVASAIVTAAGSNPDKPVLAVLMGREGLPEGRAELLEAGIPTFVFPESAARALAALNRHVEWAAKPDMRPERLSADSARAGAIIDAALTKGLATLGTIEALELLEAYGIPVARARLVTTPSGLAQAADTIGYPLVMKVSSPDIVHKTDVGGVAMHLLNESDVRRAYQEMMRSVAARAPRARVTGVVLQRMVAGGHELIAGISRDASFGPLLMFGLGGLFVEALRDVVFRMAPIDSDQAHEMLRAIRGARLLDGIRGQTAVDREAAAEALQRIAQLADDFPQIAELDANPLLAFDHGIVAVDARVTIAASA